MCVRSVMSWGWAGWLVAMWVAGSEGQNISCKDSFYCATYSLVCVDYNGTNTSFCGHCTKNEQCGELYGNSYLCLLKGDSKRCLKKPLWPLDTRDYLTFLVLVLAGTIAAGGGLGGGGIFIPVLILLGEFRMRDSVPLSNVMVGGSSIASVLSVYRSKHPHCEKPLIDYDLAMLMQPLSLCGTVIGVILNFVFPDWLIMSLLIIVLLFTSYRTVKKGIEVFQKERKASKSTDKAPLLEKKKSYSEPDSTSVKQPEEDPELYEKEKKKSYVKQLVLLVILVILAVHSLLIGGRGESIIGVLPCTALYWGLFSLIFIIMSVFSLLIIRYLLQSEAKKTESGYNYLPGDIHWTQKNTTILSLLCFAVGILSSLLGIGGGMILSPIMLELNVLPPVVAATNSFMIMFTSVAAATQYAILDRILVDYGVALLILGFLSGLVGQNGLNLIVKKYNKMSIIIFVIILILVCSVILLGVTGGIRLNKQIVNNAYLGFDPYCLN